MNYQECNVVMLPTEKVVGKYNIYKRIDGKLFCSLRINSGNQHLYITNPKEEIKGGDWVIVDDRHMLKDDPIYLLDKVEKIKNGWIHCSGIGRTSKFVKKIIATTNEDLGYGDEYGAFYQLPIPSNEFLKKYCELGGIDEVLVEYELKRRCVKCKKEKIGYLCECGEDSNYEYFEKLKVASDNTISINPVKESWSREEVIELFKKLQYEMAQQIIGNRGEDRIIPVDWIRENL